MLNLYNNIVITAIRDFIFDSSENFLSAQSSSRTKINKA